MNIEKELQKELDKIKCAEGLTIDTIRLNSDLGRKVIENVVKNLTMHFVVGRSEQLPDFDVQEINDILKECKENKDSLQTLIGRIWNKGYGEGVCYDIDKE